MYDVKVCRCNGDGPELVYLAGLSDPYAVTYFDEDHRAMDETNWDAVLSNLAHEDHWIAEDLTYGIHGDECNGCIHVLADDGDAVDILRQLVADLENYPLLDEDAYSEREWAAWVDYWTDFGFTDFVKDHVEDPNECDAVLELPASMLGDLMTAVHAGMGYWQGFSGEYDERGAGDAYDKWARDVRWLADEDRRTLGGRQVELFPRVEVDA